MSEWTPINRDEPRVEGVDPDAPGLLDVRIRLDAHPPDEWMEFFLRPVGVGISVSMHPPKLFGDEIRLRPPDNEVEKYVLHVDERIAAANKRFQSEVLPRRRREQDAAQRARQEQEQRLAEARQRLTKLKKD